MGTIAPKPVVGFIAALLTLLVNVLRGNARRTRVIAFALVSLTVAGCDGCHAPGATRPLRPDGDTRFYVSDRLGSTALVLDHDGAVVERIADQPLGEEWIHWRVTGLDSATYTYGGKERDPDSGAVAIGLRHYLPAVGRWASPDPLTLAAPGPEEIATRERNPFAYSANNPVRAMDDNGLCVDCKVEHWIQSKWTPEQRVAYNGRRPLSAREAARISRALDQADEVLTQLEIAMISAGPAGMAVAGVEGATLHMAVRGARFLMRTRRVAAGASATRQAVRTLRIPKAVGADVKLVRLRHYTRKNAIKSIKDNNLLRVGDRNGVYATSARKKPMSAQDARAKLRIGRGKGGAYVEFDANPSEYTISTVEKTGAREYVFHGNVDLSGRNPTFHKND
ncbi:MAG: hypothetical protein H6713_27325 [Myxococcales bacterium]|nr:hypothetical protein [Myxococcales bacterium]